MQGEFSVMINQLVESMIQLRIYVEAAIDFPEEEIDFLADENLRKRLHQLQAELKNILNKAQQGALLREGMTMAPVSSSQGHVPRRLTPHSRR